MTISKQLVNLMGGELQVSSIPNKGSRFYFSLQLACNPEQESTKADISALRNVNILVVDDNATNREILYGQLTHWGARCLCLSNGAEALAHLKVAQLENKRYQVVLLDWHMPDMDGLTLAKTIVSESHMPNMAMVMLSSDNTGNQEQDSGICFFLTKPVIQQKLLNCLLEVLGKGQAQPHLPNNDRKPVKVVNSLILLVEDQLVNQQVADYMLKGMGCQVEIASNGLEAVKLSATKKFDLILMDCHMPLMDGFDATKAIRAREQCAVNQQRVPIVALTADVQKEISTQCLEAGMDTFLSKPFNSQQLKSLLDQWIVVKQEDVAATLAPSINPMQK